MEQRVDKLRSHLHESRQIGLQGSVDVIVLVGRNLEVLFELRIRTSKNDSTAAGRKGGP